MDREGQQLMNGGNTVLQSTFCKSHMVDKVTTATLGNVLVHQI